MEIYDVTVWDTSVGPRDPEVWVLESPPVRVEAQDSYEAAKGVAKRAGFYLSKDSGIPRPFGGIGMFFERPDEALVFQVVESAGPAPTFPREAGIPDVVWKTKIRRLKGRRTQPSGVYEDPYESEEVDLPLRRIGPGIYERYLR